MEADIGTMREGVMVKEKYEDEVKKNPESYTPNSILKFYQKEIIRLQNTTTRMNAYLEAKDKLPQIAATLSDLMTTRPAQPLLIQEKMRELKDYERKINTFEAGKIPKEIVEEAKEVIGNLEEKIVQYSKIKIIAGVTPDFPVN